ncbi:hypothetical protein NM688_g6866 [Phlebia brevispora]|uniref:Uncharacterized protein n=1 Tax=Phlebia brevispora TaxID=194682 RepID=A0ACC1SBN6_9APHY|nr:hypothetical protein NM688_g6866 [Phlebia brevispora]
MSPHFSGFLSPLVLLDMQLAIGSLIWISIRPLLRLVLNAAFGFAITKADIFPVIAARGSGQVIVNVFTPCLMFSKIVPAFSIDNIGTLGPLFLLAFIYQAIGLVIAWVTRELFWVPYRCRNGILAMGIFGNWGDIPTSFCMSITAGPPFNSTADQTLAVAYVSVFNFVMSFMLFPMSGFRLIAMDFVGPDVEDEEMKHAARRKRRALLHFYRYLTPKTLRWRRRRAIDDEKSPSGSDEQGEKAYDDHAESIRTHYDIESAEIHPHSSAVSIAMGDLDVREDALSATAVNSRMPSGPPTDIQRSRGNSPTPSLTHVETDTHVDQDHPNGDVSPSKNVRFDEQATNSLLANISRKQRIWKQAKAFLTALAAPASLSIIIAFPIALITPLKALFVAVPNSPIPNAPDGQPPLAFIMDAATFVGAASVPTGLVCLGSAIARMQVPTDRESLKKTPVGAILALAITKIAILPIFGVLICDALTNAGVINKTDPVLRFVCFFYACLPTATSQVYLTQLYSSTGTAEHVPAFLVPQYILLVFSMTILTAYSLSIIF